MKKVEIDVGAFVELQSSAPALSKNAKNEYCARIPFDQKRWLSNKAKGEGLSLATYLKLVGLGKIEIKGAYKPQPLPAAISTASAAVRNPVVSTTVREDEWWPLQAKFVETYQMGPSSAKELVEFCVKVALGRIKVALDPVVISDLPSPVDSNLAAKDRLQEWITACLLLAGTPDQKSLKLLTGKERSWSEIESKYGDNS